jgi:hypothetical protein
MQPQTNGVPAQITSLGVEPAPSVNPFAFLGIESSVCIEEQLEKEGGPFVEDARGPSAAQPTPPASTGLFDHLGFEDSVSVEEQLDAKDLRQAAS